jgi:hypothetical protein
MSAPTDRSRFAEMLIVVGVLANALVALTAGPFPYHDATNHLARYVLLDRAWSGHPVPWAVIRLIPTPYIGIDLLGVGLVHAFGPATAQRVLALIPLLLLPAGMYALLRTTSPQHRGWGLIGVLSSFSWWYLSGSTSFWIGFSLLWFAVALWWPRRRTRRWMDRLQLTAVAAILLSIHLFPALSLLGIVWLDAALELVRGRGFRREALRELAPRVVLAILLSAGCAAVYFWMRAAVAGEPETPLALTPRPLLSKVLNLASPYYAFGLAEFLVVLAGYGIALVALARQWRREWRTDPFLMGAGAFLVLYAVSPNAWNIDLRWLPVAYLLPFFALQRDGGPSRRVLLALFACCLLHAAIVAGYAHSVRRQLHDIDVAIERVPATARLLPLVTDHHEYRLRPAVHYTLWHTIRTSSQVGGMFSRSGIREGDASYPHFSHIEIRPPMYFPLATWGVEQYTPLDCARVRRDYDYVVQVGTDTRAGALIARCARETFEIDDDVRVYQVSGPPGGGRPASAVP